MSYWRYSECSFRTIIAQSDVHKQVIVQVQPVEHEQLLQFEVLSIAKGSNRITGTITEEHMDVLSPQAVSNSTSSYNIKSSNMFTTVQRELL
jgi:hypothetical protein